MVGLDTGNPVTSNVKCIQGDFVIEGSFSLYIVNDNFQLHRDFSIIDSGNGGRGYFVQGSLGVVAFGRVTTTL